MVKYSSFAQITTALLKHGPAISQKTGVCYEWWLLTKDNKDIGFMVIDHRGHGAVCITILFINSLYRNCGYGTKFMYMLKKKAQKDDHSIAVDCVNGSQLFYEKNGFCH